MMKVEEIESLSDAQRYVEGCLNDYEAGIATKDETLGHLGKYTARIMEVFYINAKKRFKENPNFFNE